MAKWILAPLVWLVLQGAFVAAWRVDEGMWLPPRLGTDVGAETLSRMGCKIPVQGLWSDESLSLKDAILQIGDLDGTGQEVNGYGSGSFVSARGLVLTNHHVAFDAISRLSKSDNNLIEKGYVAATFEDELSCKGLAVQLTTIMEDVTEQVLSGLSAELKGAARDEALQESKNRALAAAKNAGFQNAQVVEMNSGLEYWLVAYDIFRDVRLVYAPQQGIGEFGGDIDNWMWPRHSGDFTYLRVYVGPNGERRAFDPANVPFQPERHLTISVAGYKPGDFTFIMGYPAETSRYRSAMGLESFERGELPQTITQLKSILERLENESKRSPAAALRRASDIKAINNTLKNYEGLKIGFQKERLVDGRRNHEAKLQEWINADPERQGKWGSVLPELNRLQTELRAQEPWGRALRGMLSGDSVLTAFAVAEKKANFAPGRFQITTRALTRQIGATSLDDQRAALVRNLSLLKELQDGEWPAQLRPHREKFSSLETWVAELLPQALTRPEIEALYAENAESRPAPTPLSSLVMDMVALERELDTRVQEFAERAPGLVQKLIVARSAFENRAPYPDANSTLRFTYGTVRGFDPADGVSYRHFTTIEGLVAKSTGMLPFNTPEEVLTLAGRRDFGRYLDKTSGTLQTCFLSDTDITGGNSGSPIMNGQGEMTGIAFDGIWESITSDYLFMPEKTRTISVDIRFVLWCTEKVAGLKRLIDEMTIVDS